MRNIIKSLFVLLMFMSILPVSKAYASSNLLISEYVEGSGYNKAIELYNPTDSAIQLDRFSLVSFVNGASRTSGTVVELKLSGTVEAKSTFVIANDKANAEVLNKAQIKTNHTVMNFNGDDTLVLFENYDAVSKDGTVADSIGQIGVDPGTNFGKAVSTLDMTLVRTNDLLTPDTNIEDAYNPEKQFIALPKDTFTQLGVFNGEVTQPPAEVAKDSYDVKVVRVVDGDTIKISPSIMGSDTIRFVNMDTPETYHLSQYDMNLIDTDLNHNQKYHGELAKKALNEKLAEGMPVTIKVNKDHITDDYGRVLGQVVRQSDNVNVNLEMVKEGYAVSYFIWPVLSMEDYAAFQSAVKIAQSNKVGIWQTEHALKELPFAFRARYDGKGFQRYVGDSETKVFYNPQDFEKVPVSHRIFFSKEEAIAAGYKPASNVADIIEEKAVEMTIDAARAGGKGTKAIVTGTVTHIDGYNIYIQDETAGLVVRSKTFKPEIGDVIKAEGKTAEYFGLYQIETESVSKVGTNKVNPIHKALGEIGESEEGKLISIQDITIQSVNEHNEYTVIDASGNTFLIKTTSGLEVGKSYAEVQGVVTYSYDAYKLLPTQITEKKIEVPKPKHKLKGKVFYDTNHNGKFDRPDRLLQGAVVTIQQNGERVAELTSDTQGTYEIMLSEGHYDVHVSSPLLVPTYEPKVQVNLTSDSKELLSGLSKKIGKFK